MYLVEFTVNAGGDRKEVGYLMRGTTIEEAIENAKKRAKSEFTSVRSIVKVTARESQEKDKEYINDIISNTTTHSETSLEETNITNSIENKSTVEKLVEHMSDEVKQKKVWRVVFTPGRKPRKRDHDTNFFVVEADSLNEAKSEAKRQIEELGVKFKDKWSIILPDTVENISKAKIFKKIDEQEEKDMEPKPIIAESPTLDLNMGKNFDGDAINADLFRNFDKVGVEVDDDGYIRRIHMAGLTIFDQEKVKTYMLKPIDPKNKYPQIKVETMSAANAMTLFKFVLHSTEGKLDYNDCTEISIIDQDGNMRVVDFNRFM